jgi:hypothetical protein
MVGGCKDATGLLALPGGMQRHTQEGGELRQDSVPRHPAALPR